MKSARILIAERSGAAAQHLKNRLTALGYAVLPAVASTPQALKKAELLHPDLVLISLALKGPPDPLETGRKLRERFNIPIIYLAAGADGDLSRISEKADGFEVIGNPPSDGELRDAMARVFQKSDLQVKREPHELSYRGIFENPSVAMLLIDPETAAIVDANPAACAFYGYDYARITEMKITDINMLPSERVFAEMQRARSGQCNFFQFRHRRAGGDIRDVEVYSHPIPVGGRTLLFSIIHDVTERRRAEQEREVLTRLSLRLAAASTSQGVAAVVREETHYLFGWDAFYLAFRRAGEKVFHTAIFVDTMEGQQKESLIRDWPETGISPPVRVILEGRPVLINYQPGAEEPRLDFFGFTERRSASMMFAPIRSGPHVIGIISAQSYTPNRYHAGDLERLQHLADAIAPALERVNTEEKLKETANVLQAMIAASPLPIIRLDSHGVVQTWNPAAERTFGWTAEEALGRPLPYIPKEKQGEFRAFIEATRRGETIHAAEVRRVRKDGSELDLILHTAALHDAHGRFLGPMGILEDVTERKRIEREIRDSRAQFQELFDEAPIGYYELNAEGRVVRVNRTELDMLGYTADEVVGRPIWDFVVESEVSRQAFRNKMAGIMPPGQGFERTFRRKDGTLVPVLVSEKLLRDPQGRIVGLRITTLDITDRKRAEDALRDALLCFEWVIEKTPLVAIQGFDRDGMIQHWNSASESLYGYSRAEAIGKRIQDLILPPDAVAEFETELANLWASGRPQPPQEWCVRNRHGQEHWVLSTMFPVYEGGRVVEAFCMDVDITERRKAEAALRYRLEFERILGSISADFVHCSVETLDAGILQALQTIGEFVGADRSYLFLLNKDNKTISNTHEWCAEGIAPQIHRLQNIPLDSLPCVRDHLLRDQVFLVPCVADLPPEAAAEKQEFELESIRSIVCFPLFLQDQPYGFLGLDAVRAEKTWSDDTLALLKMAGEVFVNVLERKRAETAARHGRMVAEAVAEASLRYLETSSIRTMAQVMVERAAEITGAQAGVVITLDADNRARIIAVSSKTWDLMKGEIYDAARREIEEKGCYRLPVSNSLVSAPLSRGISILTNDPQSHSYWAGTMPGWHPPVESFLAAPMKIGSNVLGMIALANRPGGFSEVELRLLETFANTAALAMRMARSEEERRTAEEQLRHAMKMEAVGRLAGGIAHDFNNLLTAIIGYADMGINSVHPAERVRRYFDEVLQAATRAADLTHQLLAFSRRQPLEPRVVNLNDILLDMANMLRRIIGEDIQLVIRPGSALGAVRVDPTQLEEVIINLAVNARDAMPGGGKLTLETANVLLDENYVSTHHAVIPGEYVLLAISDTGIGMTDEVKAHLFEPFFTTKPLGKGTGLGLATCYGFVKQSGGYIWAYSEVGQGTTFRIYLPRVYETPTALPQRDENGYLPRGNETILLVEDEESVRTLSVHILHDLGYTVFEASNGEEALQVARELGCQSLHLLLTDVVMPQRGGKSLAQHLRAENPHLKVLFISGYSEEGAIGLGAMESGTAFLQKPFTPGALARKVRELLDAPVL
ncbi:MAG: PAS domain S-box protein [Candidatus Sumerlaeia bacterium]|nr:PAS domain S-box protein [Candidatus Sumerlaeia bacterium]